MGSYRFKWPHAAEEVIVTGTFDNWSKSIKLDKKPWAHEKMVEIPDTKDEILYKFVVNGQWRTDPSHAIKRDHEGNENNILDHEDIIPSVASAAMISSVGAGATTTALAGAQPIEDKSASVPGAFPETPAETGDVKTLQDRVVGVNPLPATSGIGNPITLAPGEKVPDPSTFTDNTVQNTVTTSKEAYESGAGGAAYSPVGKTDSSDALFGRPAAGGTIIPESSLPMGDKTDPTQKDYTDPAITSAGAGSTTAALAGQQPIEPRGTPQVISKSEDAGEDKGIAAKAAAGVAVAGVAAAGAAVAANEVIKDKTGKDPVSALPESTQNAVHESAKESNIPEKAGVTSPVGQTAAGVPEDVTESQKEANVAPEASANEEAVQEKSQVEKELLAKVPTTNEQGEPAPTASAATATTVPTATSETGAPQLADPTNGGLAPINMDDKPAEKEAVPATQPATEQTKPTVTTGVADSSAPEVSTPQKRHSIADRFKSHKHSDSQSSLPATPGTSSSKKEKRRSIFKRIKDKLSS